MIESLPESIASLLEAGEEKRRLEHESLDAQLSSAESLEIMKHLLIQNERQNKANHRMQGIILAVGFATLMTAFAGIFV